MVFLLQEEHSSKTLRVSTSQAKFLATWSNAFWGNDDASCPEYESESLYEAKQKGYKRLFIVSAFGSAKASKYTTNPYPKGGIVARLVSHYDAVEWVKEHHLEDECNIDSLLPPEGHECIRERRLLNWKSDRIFSRPKRSEVKKVV